MAEHIFRRDYTGTTQAVAENGNGLAARAANPLIPFLNPGGLGQNRTADTRIFNVGGVRSRRFLIVPNLLILWGESPVERPAQFPRLPVFCVVFRAGLHRNYTGSTRSSLPRRGSDDPSALRPSFPLFLPRATAQALASRAFFRGSFASIGETSFW